MCERMWPTKGNWGLQFEVGYPSLPYLNRYRGDIYKADYEGYYCIDCEEFKDEKEMDEHKNCPTHRKPCQLRKEVWGPGSVERK